MRESCESFASVLAGAAVTALPAPQHRRAAVAAVVAAASFLD
jgi:hypothetical protein